jgi:hypothetical protein
MYLVHRCPAHRHPPCRLLSRSVVVVTPLLLSRHCHCHCRTARCHCGHHRWWVVVVVVVVVIAGCVERSMGVVWVCFG